MSIVKQQLFASRVGLLTVAGDGFQIQSLSQTRVQAKRSSFLPHLNAQVAISSPVQLKMEQALAPPLASPSNVRTASKAAAR